MGKRSKRKKTPAASAAAPTAAADSPPNASRGPTGLELAALTGLGVVAALWALFQWAELLVVRAGGTTFCSIDTTLDCRAVWDSAFASGIHGATGLPVAGWGLCWGLVATALPLWALANKGDGRDLGAPWAATLATAAGGVLAVIVMASASLQGGTLCPTCLGTYALVIGYAALSWRRWGRSRVRPWDPRALVRAGLVALVAYLVLLVPGLRTPSASDHAGLDALDAEARRQQQPTRATPDAPSPGGDVASFLASLPDELRQGVSDGLLVLRTAPAVPAHPPRALIGDPAAAVRVTDFTDVLCSHCAQLHEVLAKLRAMLPADTLSIEPRHYPLDSECNDSLKSPPRYPVRCLAAKAQICLEGNPASFDYSAALFANQQRLTEDMVYQLAAKYMGRDELAACVASPDTAAKLADDIAWAVAHDIEGTPLVLVNGRKAIGFGPLLYALALTGGNVDDPAFRDLPPPNAHAHRH